MPGSQPIIFAEASVISHNSFRPGERLRIIGVKMAVLSPGEDPIPCLELVADDGDMDLVPMPDIPGFDFIITPH